MQTVRNIAKQYWEAEESRDVNSILAYYHPNAELVAPEVGRLRGHTEIKTFYEASIRRFPSLEVEILRGFEQADQGAFEWRATFVDHEDRVVILKGVNIIVTREGKFKSVDVYYDPEPLRAVDVGRT